MAMMFGYAVLTTYWTVLVAELVSDKSIYTVASLSLRFRAGLVFWGTAAAFGGKMLVAVLFGHILVQVPGRLAASLSALIFFLAALFIWIRKPAPFPERITALPVWSRTTIVPFASLFLTEWGDPGQITAAALAAQFHLPLPVWLGGTLALMTKGGLGMTLGLKLRDRIPQKGLRVLAACSCCLLGFLVLGESFLR
jgi:putative Ca2+/H+ antiporter (TMEM165/GDT1 family)